MKEITAQEGKYLTQINIENEDNRIFVKAITGANASYDYWREAEESEKTQWEQEHMLDLNMEDSTYVTEG